MVTYTLSFCYVSNEARRTVPLVDEYGSEVALVVDAESRTAAIYLPEVAQFCQAQGNDCRVRKVYP